MGLCGFYYCAANNLSHARKGCNPFGEASLKTHTAEVMAFVKKGVATKS